MVGEEEEKLGLEGDKSGESALAGKRNRRRRRQLSSAQLDGGWFVSVPSLPPSALLSQRVRQMFAEQKGQYLDSPARLEA